MINVGTAELATDSIARGPEKATWVSIKHILVLGLGLLAPLTDIKVADIQSVELFGFVCLLVAGIIVYRDQLVIRGHRQVILLIKAYTVFILATLALAFWALQYPSYPPPGSGILKTAPYLSIARTAQLTVAIGSLILLATAIYSRPTLINLAAQSYVYGGLVCAGYGLISWFALLGGIELGGAYYVDFTRSKGFFAEGGPFGLYLVSVILVCIFRRHVLQRGDQRAYWLQLGVLCAAFLTASSKAGFLLIILLVLFYTVLSKRIRYVFLFGLLLTPGLLLSNVIEALQGYAYSYINFEQELAERSNDPSLMMGRGMAAILVPIMIADKPLTGVGIGNYSLQRNNPEYLGPLPTTHLWDLPGLGLLGYTAELGIPLLLFLVWLLWRPVTLSRKTGQRPLVALLASSQFFVHLLGAQLTFVYPWIVSAIALGYVISRSVTSNRSE